MPSSFVLIGCSLLLANPAAKLDRQVLPANDGWASTAGGTTGGAAAEAGQVWRVRNRRELVAALHDGVYPPTDLPSDTPKILHVEGRIDANVDAANRPLGCGDYQRNGYTLAAFLTAFDPATRGRAEPSGPLEDARRASQQAQAARVQIAVGSNTTLIGKGRDATLRGVSLLLGGAPARPDFRPRNIIIRNLHFEDTVDCFPQWSPDDDAHGNWNSQYDAISVRGAEQVWITHNEFVDRYSHDRYLPTLYGRPFQVHDGLLDISHGADRVTVSWNRFRNHDKSILIGGSDAHTGDAGKLRITLHHNLFDGLVQRAPRVRFGHVHVYNNVYRLRGDQAYEYSLGVGLRSAIVAEANTFIADPPHSRIQVIRTLGGSVLRARENLWNGQPLDLVGEWNAHQDPPLQTIPGNQPLPSTTPDPVARLHDIVARGAGPQDW